MKFLISDFLVAGAGIVIVSAFSLLYYKDITTKIQHGTGQAIGTITYKRKTAERKYGGQVIWEDLDHDTPVYNYDSIRTAGESEALVRLSDGTEIKLNENSMVLLSLSKNGIDIDFNQGSISANRMGKGDLQKLNIKSGNTKVSIDKSDIRLSQNNAGDISLAVAKGSADVDTGKGISNIGTDQAVLIAKNSENIIKSDSAIKLLNPGPDAYLLTPSGRKKTDFSWEYTKKNNRIFFELSRDDFGSILQKKEIRGNVFNAVLAKGIYYWRIRTVSKINKKQEQSESRRFTVLWDEPVLLTFPANQEIIPFKNIPPVINFRWTKSEIASSYRLVLASDPEMNNIMKSFDAPQNEFTVDSLLKGTYYWRVEKVTGLNNIPETAPSKISKFDIREEQFINPPELLFPENGKQFSQKLLQKKQNITFTCKNNPEIREYDFTIAADEKFEKPVYQGISKVNFYQLDKDIPRGKYFWRVSGKLDAKNSTPPSQPWTFSIMESEEIRLIHPENNASITPEGDERTASVRFSWKPSEMKGKYKTAVSKDRDFASVYKEAWEQESVSMPMEPGKYFWKVVLMDDKDILASSKVQTFIVENTLRLPAAITPKEGDIINMQNKDSLSFNWKAVEGANLYRLSLYSVRRGGEYKIADFDETGTGYKIKDLRKLDEGNFFWTLQAFEVTGRKKDVVRKSSIVKINFKITLGKPIEKVDVHSLKIENL